MSDQAIALAFETGLPFVGLRDHEHDPELDRVIPPDAARFARVVPLSATDDHVRLAAADAAPDLASLQRYLGDRRVDLAIAPRAELEELLGPAPEAAPEPLGAEPAAAVGSGSEEGEPEAEPLAEPNPELEAVGAEAEALAAEPEPEAEALAEPEPPAAEPEPEAESLAETEHAAAEPLAASGENPSWLEPPRKRGWLRAIGRFLLYVLVLAIICGAVAAYLLTR